MQATTVQMITAGMALLNKFSDIKEFKNYFFSFIDDLSKLDLAFLVLFIEEEPKHYLEKGILTYRGPTELGICILKDTIERSPIFSFASFKSTPSC